MKIVFFLFIFIFSLIFNFNKEKFANNEIFLSCNNNYDVVINNDPLVLNGLYTELLKKKYKNFNQKNEIIPICARDKNYNINYDYFNPEINTPLNTYHKTI